jgi:hypothetical protein
MSPHSRVQVRLLAAFCAATALFLFHIPPLSGTNCTLTWSAFTSGNMFVPYWPYFVPTYITHVTVTICGEQVWNQDYTDPDKKSYSGIIIFDSTHFADGTASVIQVTATINSVRVDRTLADRL